MDAQTTSFDAPLPITTSASPHFVFDSPTNPLGFPENDDTQQPSMGSMIDKIHNVQPRNERPVKKAKTEHKLGENEQTVTFRTGAGGEISSHIKEKRKEQIDKNGPVSTIVDLTADNDDDFTQIASNPSEEREVCYGRVDGAQVNAHMVPHLNPKAVILNRMEWPVIKVRLQRSPGRTHFIAVRDPLDKDFGTVDIRTALALCPLMDSIGMRIRTQARLEGRKKQPYEGIPGQGASEKYKMILNLYGPYKHAKKVGKWLSQKNVFLRAPMMADAGIEYVEAQGSGKITMPRTNVFARSTTGGNHVQRTAEEIKSDVVGLFDSLKKCEDLPTLDAHPRVVTDLLHHQKQALYFMTEREKARSVEGEEDNHTLWRSKIRADGRKIYYNVITGNEEFRRPDDVLGGILADEMGLGKTLSILSLIATTLSDAEEWAETAVIKSHHEGHKMRNVKTTLLVCPLSVISNWEEQIATHIKPGVMSFYVYHGTNRKQNPDELAQHDIIITTYAVVSSELNRRTKKADISPFVTLNFFRIVLDEAHMIREQSTQQSKAICALEANRRWALTGTPVQNRLDDLGALIKFLRVKPFDQSNAFSQYILSPFKNADPDILPKLRLLVDMITIRRSKETVNLPPRHDEIIKLTFNEDEQKLYNWFSQDASTRLQAISDIGGKKKPTLGGKGYVHILRSILCLRLISAHGRELLRDDDLKMVEGLSLSNAIDLDAEEFQPVLSERQVYEMFTLFKDTDNDTCAQCMKKVGLKDPSDEDAKDEMMGTMLPCYQIVCNDCIASVKNTISKSIQGERFPCPFCKQALKISFYELKPAGLDAYEEHKRQIRENPKHAKMIGRYSGPHTKTKALMADLQASALESMSFAQGDDPMPPIKSVIFSGWTTHLDLIQMALDDAHFTYVRLDGSTSRSQRRQVLNTFREDPAVTVILISINAGGLGLNLTAANKVYVMEPQYNPAAEAQAVDRVHRLGQEREVWVKRFIMRDSIEESMLKLQAKKRDLANLSMNRGKLDKEEAAKRKLEELKSLFK